MFVNDSNTTSVDIIEVKTPTILITNTALAKMKLFVDGCDDEIGWLGVAEDYDGAIVIDDVMLFEQEVNSVTTEITPEGLSEFGQKLLLEENGVDKWNSIRLWGHSHVNMGVTPSGQDDSQMVTFKDNGHDWFIRVIANKKGKLRLDYYNYDLGISYQNTPWYIFETEEEREIIKEIANLEAKLAEMNASAIEENRKFVEKEIKDKVKKKSYSVTTYGGYSAWQNKGVKPTKVNKVDKTYYGSEDDDVYGVVDYYEDYYEDKFFNQEAMFGEGAPSRYEDTKGLLDDELIEELKETNLMYNIFDKTMMEELIGVNSVDEARGIINEYGFDDVYTSDEIVQKIQEYNEEKKKGDE